MGFESSSICSSSFIQLPSTEVCAQFFSVETSIKTIHCWNTKATEGQVLRNRCYCWLEWFYELHEKFPISVTNEEFGGILDEQQYSMPNCSTLRYKERLIALWPQPLKRLWCLHLPSTSHTCFKKLLSLIYKLGVI